MSIPKAVGIEQEYAIKVKGGEPLSAFHASCMIINAYARSLGLREKDTRMIWDYGHETPFQDIRGDLFSKNTGQEIISHEENQRINTVLPNGARLYTDHAHPEYSTPESLSAKEVIACDKAGEQILLQGIRLAKSDLPLTQITLFKNNTDHQGHSYGCHENYLMDAKAHTEAFTGKADKALSILIPFLVTRQIFAGAGKIGKERTDAAASPYQISQRADFMETLFGLETMYARPLINTRAEHHANDTRFRRLHLISGDANMCEVPAFLKIGTTQIILQMMEDDFITDGFTLKDPIQAVRQISDRFDSMIELADGRCMTALECQKRFLEWAEKYHTRSAANAVPDAERILEYWQKILKGLERLKISDDFDIEDDPESVYQQSDWLLKLWLINRYRQGKRLRWDDPHLQVLDLKYHHIDPAESIFYRLQAQGIPRRVLTDDDIREFIHHPPEDTRAYFRGKCIEKFPKEIYLINWEVVGFEQGEVYRMIPLLNPLKGTCEQFEAMFQECRNAQEMIERITGEYE